MTYLSDEAAAKKIFEIMGDQEQWSLITLLKSQYDRLIDQLNAELRQRTITVRDLENGLAKANRHRKNERESKVKAANHSLDLANEVAGLEDVISSMAFDLEHPFKYWFNRLYKKLRG